MAIGVLQNIRAVNQLIDGDHKSQTVNTVNLSDQVESNVVRSEGDEWVDLDGVTWVQFNGFKLRKSNLKAIRDVLKSFNMPDTCPKCSKPMTKRLDQKFWKLDGHCFDCQIAYEHILKISGEYESYEADRIKRNALAWIESAERDAVDIIESFRKAPEFINSDGSVEQWEGGKSHIEIADAIEVEFKQFKENFLKQYA